MAGVGKPPRRRNAGRAAANHDHLDVTTRHHREFPCARPHMCELIRPYTKARRRSASHLRRCCGGWFAVRNLAN